MEKAFLTAKDIQERYACGVNKAVQIISAVRQFCGGGSLPKGKILPSELRAWEERSVGK